MLDFEADLELAARKVDLDPWVLQRLKHPEREITINIPFTRADGSAINVAAYRIQHNRSQGPCIGPLFLARTAHPASLRQSAAMITLQSALLGIRLGGAAGAIVCDPSTLAERELSHLVTGYIGALRDETGPHHDVFAVTRPDWLMRCVRNSVKNLRGNVEPAAVVGNALLTPAIASTTLALIRRALDTPDLSRLRVACQGFGHVARPLLEALDRENARVVAVADRSGAVMRPEGLELSELRTYAKNSGVVFGFPDAEPASNADVLESDCDLLILAAAERQVGPHNAAHIGARAILELTENALCVSPERLPGCLVIPYLLAGCPRVSAWSYEWQQGLSYADLDVNHAAEISTRRTLATLEQIRNSNTGDHVPLSRATLRIALCNLSQSLRL